MATTLQDGSDTSQALPPDGVVDQIVSTIQLGGPVVSILIAMSIIALALILLKIWQFQTVRISQRGLARKAISFYASGNTREALQLAESSPNPAAQALANAIRGQQRGLSEHIVREEVLRQGADALFTLRGWLRPLEVIGTLAPLLGLFGTVLGMIEAFQQLQAAGSQVNPAVLSGGIWEVLLTTAVGLAVAIPVVAALNWLERRVDRLAHEMDFVVTRVFTQDLSYNREAEHDAANTALQPAPAVE